VPLDGNVHYCQVDYQQHQLGYANITDWSPILPSENPGEVISVLIRYGLLVFDKVLFIDDENGISLYGTAPYIGIYSLYSGWFYSCDERRCCSVVIGGIKCVTQRALHHQ
jgi:hypothetical protein